MPTKDIQKFSIGGGITSGGVSYSYGGMSSSEVQNDISKINSIKSGVGGGIMSDGFSYSYNKVQDNISNFDARLPMVNMTHDKFCSSANNVCLGLSSDMCGDDKKVKCSDVKITCDFLKSLCGSKLR